MWVQVIMRAELVFIICAIQVNLFMLKGFNLINIKWIQLILTVLALRLIQYYVVDRVNKDRKLKNISKTKELMKILKELSKEDKIDG